MINEQEYMEQNKLDVVLGLQWGDEGKGKVVDVLTPSYKVVARFQGGPNAGHSLVFDGDSFVLHTVPSGIFREGTVNVIGNGVVIGQRVGFIDRANFTHQFKALYGLTPDQWRKQQK